MYVRYDSLNRNEPLVLTLCNPGSIRSENGTLTRVVGMLSDTSDEELVLNFNATSELNFRIYKVRRCDDEADTHTAAMYFGIQPRRLIYVSGIGYFAISTVDEDVSDNGPYKDVRAESIEIELQNKKVPYIKDGTYRLASDDTTTVGLMETLVAVLPMWKVGHVDDEVASKYRTFEDVGTDQNILSFLLDDVQDAYECIVLFDIMNRVINVYDQANFVHQTDIHLTRDDLVKSIDISENADNLYTAISVMGDENVTISAINPLGGNVLYDFRYYYDWMSDGLREKVKAWQSEIETQKQTYYDLNVGYYTDMETASNHSLEIQKIETQITMYKRCRDNIVAESSTDLVKDYNAIIVDNDGKEIHVYEEIAETLAEIDGYIQECQNQRAAVQADLDALNASLDVTNEKITAIRDVLAIKNYFTESEYDELGSYIFEGSYQDDYVTFTDIMSYTEKFAQMKILYDRAEKTLLSASSPTQEFKVDSENFIFAKAFEHWSSQLETGCLINVELHENDIASLFLTNITVNYADKELSLTFGNRYNRFDTKSLFDSVLGSVSKSENTLNYVRDIIYPIKNGELNAMQEALATTRNLTMDAAISASNEQVIIDDSGYTGKKKNPDGSFDPRQVKITGKSIVMTDDAWQTCKVAIGELLLGDGKTIYGINAKAIIGDMILGNSIRIVDVNGNDIFSVIDQSVKANVHDLEVRVDNLGGDGDEQGVQRVKTSTGYLFDKNGLRISQTGSDITNLITNMGMYVKRGHGDTEVTMLQADSGGVNATDLTANNYLIIGKHARFEDYGDDSNPRTGCFYI